MAMHTRSVLVTTLDMLTSMSVAMMLQVLAPARRRKIPNCLSTVTARAPTFEGVRKMFEALMVSSTELKTSLVTRKNDLNWSLFREEALSQKYVLGLRVSMSSLRDSSSAALDAEAAAPASTKKAVMMASMTAGERMGCVRAMAARLQGEAVVPQSRGKMALFLGVFFKI